MTAPQTALKPREATTVPSLEVLVSRARALAPMLSERAVATEREGRVSSEVIERLRADDLLRLTRPARYGGYELTPSQLFEVGFEIGRACGSTAWCAMIGNCNSWFASYFPLEAQEKIWGENPDALVVATAAPTGQCERLDGGWRISGRWPFASNCDNSSWAIVSAMAPEVDGEGAGAAWFLVPMADLAIDHGSWRVSGLQGTGSKTLVAQSPIFVPDAHVVRFSAIVAGATPGGAIPGNRLADYAFSTFGAAALVAPLLGMAQGALDWFVEAMQTKVRLAIRPGAPITAAQSPATQARVGAASAAIDAARALLRADLGQAECRIAEGQMLDVAERIRVRRALVFTAAQAVTAVNLLFEGAGASSVDLDTPIQRHWRDINAGARHVSLDVQAVYGLVGQERFGLPPMGGF